MDMTPHEIEQGKRDFEKFVTFLRLHSPDNCFDILQDIITTINTLGPIGALDHYGMEKFNYLHSTFRYIDYRAHEMEKIAKELFRNEKTDEK